MAGIYLHKRICTDCSPSIQSQTFAISYRGLGKKGFQRSRPTLLVWSSSSLPEIQPQWLQMPIFPVNKKFCWSFVCTLYLNTVVHTYHKKSPAHVFHLRAWYVAVCFLANTVVFTHTRPSKTSLTDWASHNLLVANDHVSGDFYPV